jgi:uncharacterized membrane protein
MQDLTPVAAALTIAAAIWVALVVASPVALVRNRLPAMTIPTYHIGSLVCHQRPERSFRVAGMQMPVCARCFGLYTAGAVGLLSGWARRRPLSRSATRNILAFGALPILLTVVLEWIRVIDTSNLARMLTGLPLGLAAGLVVTRSLRP